MRIKATIEFDVPEQLVEECKLARTAMEESTDWFNLDDWEKFNAMANEIVKHLSSNLAVDGETC